MTFYHTSAQSSFQQDSLKLVELTNGLDTFYTNPVFYKQQIFEAFPLVNQMLEKNPQKLFLKKKRIEIYRMYHIFIRQELNFDESLNFILQNIEYRKEINDSCGLSLSYRSLGNFWRYQRNFDKAYTQLYKALAIAEKCGNNIEIAKATMDIGRAYHTEKKLDSALLFHSKALEISKQNNFVGGVANAHYQISRNYNQRKEFDQSLYHLNLARKGFKETNNVSSLERVNSTYANHYRKTGQPEKAVAYFKDAITYNLKLKDSVRLMSRYLGLSNSYNEMKNYKGAYDYYIKYKKLQKKMNDKKYYGQLIQLEAKLNYEHQKKVDSLQFAKQKQLDESRIKEAANSRFWWFVILFSAVVVTILIFYLNNRHKLKEQAYQNILLNKKVASKTEEIQELLKETMKHLKSKEKIATNLQKFSKEKDEVTLQSILTDLKASKADDTKLMLIKENIEKMNYEFLKALKERHPNLSKTEIEVSSFIKMGLSRKEIAEVRGTSDYAVKTMRNRIRKKMGIDASITLDNYLNSI
jgi:tetratricopeptide (TPR) repeat protein